MQVSSLENFSMKTTYTATHHWNNQQRPIQGQLEMKISKIKIFSRWIKSGLTLGYSQAMENLFICHVKIWHERTLTSTGHALFSILQFNIIIRFISFSCITKLHIYYKSSIGKSQGQTCSIFLYIVFCRISKFRVKKIHSLFKDFLFYLK